MIDNSTSPLPAPLSVVENDDDHTPHPPLPHTSTTSSQHSPKTIENLSLYTRIWDGRINRAWMPGQKILEKTNVTTTKCRIVFELYKIPTNDTYGANETGTEETEKNGDMEQSHQDHVANILFLYEDKGAFITMRRKDSKELMQNDDESTIGIQEEENIADCSILGSMTFDKLYDDNYPTTVSEEQEIEDILSDDKELRANESSIIPSTSSELDASFGDEVKEEVCLPSGDNKGNDLNNDGTENDKRQHEKMSKETKSVKSLMKARLKFRRGKEKTSKASKAVQSGLKMIKDTTSEAITNIDKKTHASEAVQYGFKAIKDTSNDVITNIDTKTHVSGALRSGIKAATGVTGRSASVVSKMSKDILNPSVEVHWKPKFNVMLRCLDVEKHSTRSNSLNIRILLKGKSHVHKIDFISTEEAQSFYDIIAKHKKKEHVRAMKQMMKDLSVTSTEELKILVEIVSAQDLIEANGFRLSNPLVKVHMGDVKVHRTRYLKKTIEPIWTVSTDSLFLLEVTAEKLYECLEGLRFEVISHDVVRNRDGKGLGVVYVRPSTVYKGKGERIEFKLQNKIGGNLPTKGTLVLRFRHATADDIDFMKIFKKSDNGSGVVKNIMKQINKVTTTETTYKKEDILMIPTFPVAPDPTPPHPGAQYKNKIRVLPGPDPNKVHRTTWMTPDEIKRHSLDPSEKWIEAGNGEDATIFLEIIGCDDLPNLDFQYQGLVKDSTDAFVCIICEEMCVFTHAISDCLSPRWMPWTQRAFAFNVKRLSSPLYIGVFDYDEMSFSHDPVGRVTVNVVNITPNSDCTLTYDLYTSAQRRRREKHGTITFRLRVEYDDHRKVLLSNLDMFPQLFINCPTKKMHGVVSYTCLGDVDRYQFSLKVIASYLEELSSYEWCYILMQDMLINHLLWRGNTVYFIRDVSNQAKMIVPKFPINSLLSFIYFAILVEHPWLIPSFICLFLAWLMTEALQYRRSNPSPWRRPRSFVELLYALIKGKSFDPKAIDAFKNEEELKLFIEFWQKRVEAAKNMAAAQEEERLALEREADELSYDVKTDDASQKQDKTNLLLKPLKPWIFPLQLWIGSLIDFMRITRNVIMWEEPILSFWITLGFILLAIIFIIIPWGFIIYWLFRIIVWVFMGPWMMLFDCVLSEIDDYSQLHDTILLRDAEKRLLAVRRERRIQLEQQKKLFDMKKHRFGRFIMQVPVPKTDRHTDLPLPMSFATPHVKVNKIKNNKNRLTKSHDQSLYGDMIHNVKPHSSSF